jgi:hypothetical protein
MGWRRQDGRKADIFFRSLFGFGTVELGIADFPECLLDKIISRLI